jgi:hypothetical protein
MIRGGTAQAPHSGLSRTAAALCPHPLDPRHISAMSQADRGRNLATWARRKILKHCQNDRRMGFYL